MARIAGVNIPTNKRVEIALTYIHRRGLRTRFALRQKMDRMARTLPMFAGCHKKVSKSEARRLAARRALAAPSPRPRRALAAPSPRPRGARCLTGHDSLPNSRLSR